MTARVAVLPGDGLTLVRPGIVAVVLAPQARAAGTSRLLGLIGSFAGEDLVREATRAVMHDEEIPDFGLVVGGLESATVLLHGEIGFAALVEGMEMSGRGAGAHEWVERTLPAPVEWIAIGTDAATRPEADWWDLREGTAPGATAWFIAAPAPAAQPAAPSAAQSEAPPAGQSAAPPPPPPPAAAPAPAPVVLVDLAAGVDDLAQRAPLPPVAAAAPPSAAPADQVAVAIDDDDEVVIVRGVRCPEDHHNNPRASYCSLCGRRMGVSRSLVMVDGPRPPLGVLIVDDGATIPVRHDMVIGRTPGGHALVVEGKARAVAISDSSRAISRAHLGVRLDGWDVLVSDLGSSNGTFLLDEATNSWQPLAPGVEAVIEGRQRIRLGGRELLFAPHHVAS